MSYQGGPTLVFRMDEESSQGTVTPPVRPLTVNCFSISMFH